MTSEPPADAERPRAQRRGRRAATWVALGVIVVGAVAIGASIFAPAAPPSTAPVESFPGGDTVAFYGDSYTLGTGASDPALRWSSIVAAERGWNEVNPSVNGLGFVNNRDAGGPDLVEQVIAAKPDIVFVTMGLNDNFSMPGRAADIQAAITEDFSTLKAELPKARFVVVEPFWYTDERPESVEQIIGWVREAASVINADYIPDASRWLEGRPELMASDGLHPNDAGYEVMAEKMDAALVKLGL